MIIGSVAIKRFFPDFPREPNDIDIIMSKSLEHKEYPNLRKEYLDNPVLLKYYVGEDYLPISALYTLKLSHIFWDIKRDKHLFDIQWLKAKGCVVIPDLFYELYAFWEKTHGKNRRSNLDMSSEDFFDNALTCEHSHDYLHTLIQDPPSYTKILKDGKEVDVCEYKFNRLSREEKLAVVREEVYVMAYERYKGMYKRSYIKMLNKFIYNHAPLWEALFILDKYTELSKCPIDYVTIINNKLNKENKMENLEQFKAIAEVINAGLLDPTRSKFFVEKKLGHTGIDNDEGNQAGYNEYSCVHKHPALPFSIQLAYITDSYEDKDILVSIEFVTKQEVTTIDYKSI